MKRSLFLIFLFASSIFSSENIEGFRDIKFGDPVQVLGDVSLEEELGEANTTSYIKKNEFLKIGSNELINITYFFFQDRLYEVQVKCKKNGCENIKEIFEDKYGKFRLTKPYLPVHSGDLSKNYIIKNFPQRPDFSTKEGIFYIISSEIKNELEKHVKLASGEKDSISEMIKKTETFSLEGVEDL